MPTSGQLSRSAAFEQQTHRNEASLDQILNLLSIMQKCRLNRMKYITDNDLPNVLNLWDVFTLEDVLFQLERAYEPKIKIRPSLFGTIARMAQERGIINHVGHGRASKDSSNNREVRTYKWSQ